jgi:hypothetical protein
MRALEYSTHFSRDRKAEVDMYTLGREGSFNGVHADCIHTSRSRASRVYKLGTLLSSRLL